MTMEQRTTDATTGAQKGIKLERYDLIPPEVEDAIARHFGMGAFKYAPRNWEAGMDWSKNYQAARRHLAKFWAGDDYDDDPFYDQFPPEARPLHVVAAAWHCIVLAEYFRTHPEKDDRPCWDGVEDDQRAQEEAEAEEAAEALHEEAEDIANSLIRTMLLDFLKFGRTVEWAPDATDVDYVDTFLGDPSNTEPTGPPPDTPPAEKLPIDPPGAAVAVKDSRVNGAEVIDLAEHGGAS